ncbi:YbdD/YjiX family protein [Yersinia pseudotuberculosis]|uniref:YbdD/YjiX family protein n=1 Tax=Yersinia pseudotuberculosis TaxID=633 RepID=UPI0005E2E05A|nr:YbdD/YjiX family protein [Yersinia pseudotuberculosis]CNB97055.1 small protein yjiX [Yersinia pseudotuberculosis]
MVNTGIPYRSRPITGGKITRCVPLTQVEAAPTTLWAWVRLITHRLAQSFRLMVGVQDYSNYVNHMRHKHHDTPPMTERDFHRYCLDARFPSEGGKLGKCPC